MIPRLLCTWLTCLAAACTVNTGLAPQPPIKCGAEGRCPPGTVCANDGFCRPADAGVPTDGGTPLDGGALDGGGTDGGSTLDGGGVDGGSADGGAADGGATDGGAVDGGFGLVVVPGAGSAELRWNPVAGATDYLVCHAPTPGPCAGATVSTSGKTAERVTGLPLDTRYFAVRAKIGGADGPTSAEHDSPLFTLSEHLRQEGTAASQRLGQALAAVGDVNADGKADFVVGIPSASPGGRTNAGSVFVYSGADGRLLLTRHGQADNQFLGKYVGGAGDVNKDGKADVIVAGVFVVLVLSGADGRVLHTKSGLLSQAGGVGTAGDVDGDGHADFIVGGLGGNGPTVYSGADGNPLYPKTDGTETEWFGAAVASAGDVDDDGHDDFIIGAPHTKTDVGRAVVYSGSSGDVLYDKEGTGAKFQYFGTAVAGAGDVDGDGYADFIVGAPGNIALAGKAFVYSGATGEVLHELAGSANGDQFGAAVAGVGDIDGDGHADFAVGAPGLTSDRGGVLVYSGADGSLLYQWVLGEYGDEIGAAVSAADFTGDGRPDLLVGAPGATSSGQAGLSEAGAAFVLNTAGALGLKASESTWPIGAQGLAAVQVPVIVAGTSVQLTATGGTPPYGFAVITNPNGASSVTGTGSYTATSTAAVYDTLRVTDSLGRTHDTRFWVQTHTRGIPIDGALAEDRFGIAAAALGDLDGDGKADFLVGTHGPPGTTIRPSAATVFSGDGGEVLRKLESPGSIDRFGDAVALAGDLDGDGIPDFLVGAPEGDMDTTLDIGRAYAYSGADFTLLVEKIGQAGFDNFGAAVASLGDVNDDGRPEFAVGAPAADPGGRGGAGSVYVYFGDTNSMSPLHFQKDGATSGDAFGTCVAAAGDLTGDGKPDLLVGAPHTLVGQNGDAGTVYVYSGADGSYVRQYDGTSASETFGKSCASAGDVDGDGVTDFIIGSPGADPPGKPNAGKAFVYSGKDGNPIWELLGVSASEGFGTSVSSAGDVNGDGHADLVVGGKLETFYVYSGADGSLLYQKDGPAGVGVFPPVVSSAGDVNGDGIADFLFGNSAADPGAMTDAGSAVVYVSLPRGPTLRRPKSLTATPVAGGQAALGWLDASSGEEGFRVEYRRPAETWSQAPTVAANESGAVVSGLTPNTLYFFRVKAYNGSGDSLWSRVASMVAAQ